MRILNFIFLIACVTSNSSFGGGSSGGSNRCSQLDLEHFEQSLDSLRIGADGYISFPRKGEANWEKLPEPYMGNGPTGIPHLRSVIEQRGLTVVFEGKRPSFPDLEKSLTQFFPTGVKVLFSEELPPKERQRVNGVVLHIGAVPRFSHLIRGEVNPMLGWGRLHGRLDKYNEALLAEKIAPGSMPETFGYRAVEAVLANRRSEVLNKFLTLNPADPGFSAAVRRLKQPLVDLLTDFFVQAENVAGKGAFVKLRYEFQTGDKEGQITTSQTDRISTHVNRFVDEYSLLAPHLPKSGSGNVETIHRMLDLRLQSRSAKLVDALVFNPHFLLFQRRLPIATDVFGNPVEFRVDFINGSAVTVNSRYSTAPALSELQEVRDFFSRNFENAPGKFRFLAGGADVIKLQDGSYKLIEFNFGGESGFLDFSGNPYSVASYISALTGRKAPIIEYTDRMVTETDPAKKRQLIYHVRAHLNRNAGLPYDGNYATFLAVVQMRIAVREKIIGDFAALPQSERKTKAPEVIKLMEELFANRDGHEDWVLGPGVDYVKKLMQ